MAQAENAICWLCSRPIGKQVEWHHPIPKSRGGRDKVAIHPICHRTLHARFTNGELHRLGADPANLRSDGEIARFLAWIEGKDPEFHAPTRRRK
jgi:hypothetical protein